MYRAAADLKSHVELAARELSLERFSKFEVDLHAVRENLPVSFFPYSLLTRVLFNIEHSCFGQRKWIE